MKISSLQLISELKSTVQEHIRYAETLQQKTERELNFRVSEDSWSVLECIEHLNRYGEFYIPEISSRISASQSSPKATFSPGILGNYFAKSMLPKTKLNKMKTFKSMNPIHSQLDKKVLDTFILQQDQLLELLQKAEHINIGKTRTSISISKLIRLKLGDTFRFVIYHNIRHLEQAKRVLAAV
ncbi:hypothetical protein HNP38_000513 [Chryseobacterium defluvii]|uniref:DinB-like domain-containing protein n=1 Tax=Chryseobacterium defluvii TaxID=160396 RepID=A0A840K6U9_9FLAO|nr:DinB family protein [Chryseobacterium defluvii]MBB4805241.1 hypothetical protein [Chryseobacterium defluvii]